MSILDDLALENAEPTADDLALIENDPELAEILADERYYYSDPLAYPTIGYYDEYDSYDDYYDEY